LYSPNDYYATSNDARNNIWVVIRGLKFKSTDEKWRNITPDRLFQQF